MTQDHPLTRREARERTGMSSDWRSAEAVPPAPEMPSHEQTSAVDTVQPAGTVARSRRELRAMLAAQEAADHTASDQASHWQSTRHTGVIPLVDAPLSRAARRSGQMTPEYPGDERSAAETVDRPVVGYSSAAPESTGGFDPQILAQEESRARAEARAQEEAQRARAEAEAQARAEAEAQAEAEAPARAEAQAEWQAQAAAPVWAEPEPQTRAMMRAQEGARTRSEGDTQAPTWVATPAQVFDSYTQPAQQPRIAPAVPLSEHPPLVPNPGTSPVATTGITPTVASTALGVIAASAGRLDHMSVATEEAPTPTPTVDAVPSGDVAASASAGPEPDEAERDDFDSVIRSATARGLTLNTNTLVLPALPEQLRTTSVTETGEILVTGSVELPRALTETGARSQLDSSHVDHLEHGADVPHGGDHSPVAATNAISTIAPSTEFITPPSRERANAPLILAITAGLITAGVMGAVIYGAVNHWF